MGLTTAVSRKVCMGSPLTGEPIHTFLDTTDEKEDWVKKSDIYRYWRHCWRGHHCRVG